MRSDLSLRDNHLIFFLAVIHTDKQHGDIIDVGSSLAFPLQYRRVAMRKDVH